VPIDMQTGALAADDCPPEDIRIEYFLPGTEPLDYCPLHGGESRGRGHVRSDPRPVRRRTKCGRGRRNGIRKRARCICGPDIRQRHI
jgi:hypothetical protein